MPALLTTSFTVKSWQVPSEILKKGARHVDDIVVSLAVGRSCSSGGGGGARARRCPAHRRRVRRGGVAPPFAMGLARALRGGRGSRLGPRPCFRLVLPAA